MSKKFFYQHQSSWEACSKTTLFNTSHAAYILPDQCEIASSAPVLLLSIVTVGVNITTAICVLLCIRKCWKYHYYVQLIQIITLGHQRLKRTKLRAT